MSHGKTCRYALTLYGRKLYNSTTDGAGDIHRIALSIGTCPCNGDATNGLSSGDSIALLDAECGKLSIAGGTDIDDLSIDLSIVGCIERVAVVDVVADATRDSENGKYNENRN